MLPIERNSFKTLSVLSFDSPIKSNNHDLKIILKTEIVIEKLNINNCHQLYLYFAVSVTKLQKCYKTRELIMS